MPQPTRCLAAPSGLAAAHRRLPPYLHRCFGSSSSSSGRAYHSSSRRRRPNRETTIVQAALPQSLMGAAARAAALVPSLAAAATSSIDPAVLSATVNASGKLFLICAAVGWLLRTGRIPNSTATVLSQVSFQLLIPCMLFSKVASTLAANPDPVLLAGIAAAAVLQILAGAACGLLLAPLLGLGPDQLDPQQRGSSWRGRSSPAAASAIALSLAAASGAPQAAVALRPKQPPPPAGPYQMVASSAAFGNSFTLPAIFFATLLPPALADRALGYAALFLLAWSPCLWSFGLSLVGGRPPSQQQQQQQLDLEQQQQGPAEAWQQEGSGSGSIEQRQPWRFGWRHPPVVDVTPGSGDAASTQALPAPPSWVEWLAGHPATKRALQLGSQVLNPPVLAILAGVVAGFSPLGRALLLVASNGGGGGVAALPPELGLLHSCTKAALEVVELLAAGTLAIQTLVLAASLLQQPEAPATPAALAASVGPAAAATAAGAAGLHRRSWLSAAKQALLPENAAEARALAVLVLTRFLLVPLATIAALQGLAAGGLLPPVMSDPLLLFVLLVESCMPSAQNLIILLQVSERTQALAPSFARMLLKLYAYACIPVTIWVSAFATNLGLHLR